MPIKKLEDIVSLFDTAKGTDQSYLPQAIMLYQMEAYKSLMNSKSKKSATGDSAFD